MNKNTHSEIGNISEEPVIQEREGEQRVTETASLASLGGVIAALLASLCCIGPVAFGALGVGVGATGLLAGTASFLKAFVPYRPFFIVVAIMAIGIGFYLVYRKPNAACAVGSPCSHSRRRSKSVFVLWCATALTLVFVLSPYWLGMFN
ncbi:MAG: mercuric transporter MerT family protein [Nitrospirales bacterium]